MSKSFIFSSESVTEGHPDKICDSISDAILDACLQEDASSRVACEVFVKDNVVGLAGEISTNASQCDYAKIVKDTIQSIGYDPALYAHSPYSYTCKFEKNAFLINMLGSQSPDIAQGVNASKAQDKNHEEQGAGDQGIMFGYATNDSPTLMPAPIYYAHLLGQKLTSLRKDGTHPWLRPDSKTQVSVRYIDGKPSSFSSIVISTMHAKEITTPQIREILKKDLIEAVLPAELLTDQTEILINPTGLFVIGGPEGDAGLTGRKIIVDTYGGMGRHGGGAFSGKDPSKVDRSAAYMCRWVAKNIVAAQLAKECELQVAYAIGHPHPVGLNINTFRTNALDEERIKKAVKEVFSFKPADIITQLNLLRPIYSKTTNYGHFGREDAGLPWEETNRVKDLLNAL